MKYVKLPVAWLLRMACGVNGYEIPMKESFKPAVPAAVDEPG